MMMSSMTRYDVIGREDKEKKKNISIDLAKRT